MKDPGGCDLPGMQIRKRILFLAVPAICCLLGGVWLVWGWRLLSSDVRIMRRVGSEAFKARAYLGLAGPSVLIRAQDACIPHHPKGSACVCESIKDAWKELPEAQQNRFIKSVETRLANTGVYDESSHLYVHMLAFQWGRERSRETILAAALSPNADVRSWAHWLLGERSEDFEPAEKEHLLSELLTNGMKAVDARMVTDALVLAKWMGRPSFLDAHEREIEGIVGKPGYERVEGVLRMHLKAIRARRGLPTTRAEEP